MSSRLRWVLGIAGVVVVGVIVAASIASRDKNIPRVTTTKVSKADLISTVSCNGRIQAKTKVEISSQVMGQIVNLAVREGDIVKKGDFLLQIDKAQYDANARAQQAYIDSLFAQRDSDRATLAQAERDYEREKKNFEAKISSEQVYQKARLALDAARAAVSGIEQRIQQARAQLAASQDSLSKTTLKSPINGVVTARPVEAGENAVVGTMNNPGTVLLTISDMSIVEAEMEVDETDIPRVKLNQKAKLTIDAYPEKTYEGVVTEIGGSPITKSVLGTDASAVNFKVKIQIENPPESLRPGFSTTAEIETDRKTQALAIPIPALVVAEESTLVRVKKGKGNPPPAPTPAVSSKGKGKKQEVEGVFVVKQDGTVEFKKVKTGITAELSIEILEGVAEGEEVITGPFKALRALRIADRVKVDNSDIPRDEKKS